MNDTYEHCNETVIYVAESVPGPSENSLEYIKLIEYINSQLTKSCTCATLCLPDICQCGGSNYICSTDSNNFSLRLSKLDNTMAVSIIECNDLCVCPEDCGNRLVQKGPIEGLYIKSCEIKDKGLGLFSEKFISSGSFICEYAGEIITRSQAESRHKHNLLHSKMNYIFCLKEHCGSEITQTFVDPSYLGNIGRYANHSCDPNCFIIPVRVNSPVPKLAIFSSSNILAHTEITFRYGLPSSQPSTSHIASRKKCLCQSPKCMGWMPYDIY